MVDVDTGLPPNKKTKKTIYESFKSEDSFFTNLEIVESVPPLSVPNSIILVCLFSKILLLLNDHHF